MQAEKAAALFCVEPLCDEGWTAMVGVGPTRATLGLAELLERDAR
jgi:hypothetical protein